ncbi:hypothetical protein PR202_ga23580 [Eleusine coracana subsp. coracana]|uniref:DUF1639 family protein n=1 Tax=Eleusine coracana subsp. coracana TaxID=191504 RepID=A0AAV5D777_ELECO|nr:hypothetical protein QOZ80_1BG0057230 [Eleusine coracana subsp. coracana]GJN05905.1 hypothetical protein PR202_ga23580 [Eleusine coracana subsp. coracana]
MVISAEPPPPPPPDPVADAAAAEVAAATTNARQAAFSSFPSLKTWGSHRVLRCAAHVSRRGDAAVAVAATARRPAEKLREVGEKLLHHHDEVEVAGSEGAAPVADADDAEEEEEALEAMRPRTRRRRRRGTAVATPPASTSPQAERRPPRAVRGEHLDRARFSVTLTAEEIDEDIYAVTGVRARRRPRRRPRPVQKQLDMLFPGSWLSEITAETYRVPDNR